MHPQSDVTLERNHKGNTAELLALEPETVLQGQQLPATAGVALHHHAANTVPDCVLCCYVTDLM